MQLKWQLEKLFGLYSNKFPLVGMKLTGKIEFTCIQETTSKRDIAIN